MLPKFHILLGFFFSSIILFIFPEIGPLGFIVIWSASFLIDVDHYLFYAITKKDWNLKNAHSWFLKKNKEVMKWSYDERRKKLNALPCIFHGIEAIIVLIFLSFLSKFFIYILIGFLFHEFLDFIWGIYYGFPLNHIGSQTYNILNYSKLKN